MDKYKKWIEDYLADHLSPEDRTAFEQQLRIDQSLRDDLKLWREIKDAVSDPAVTAFREQVRQVVKQQSYSKVIRKWIAWGSAAAVFLLISIGIGGYFMRSKKPERLYAQYFEPNIDFSGDRSISPVDTVSQKFNQALQAQDYSLLLDLMKTHQPAGYSSAYFLAYGQVWLLNSQPDSAVFYFKKVIAGYEMEKKWFLAMAYLQAGKSAEALPLVEGVAAQPGVYYSKARALLSDMK